MKKELEKGGKDDRIKIDADPVVVPRPATEVWMDEITRMKLKIQLMKCDIILEKRIERKRLEVGRG